MTRNLKQNLQINIKHADDYFFKVASRNIKKIRTEKMLTQEQLAEAINISTPYMSDIENEKRDKRPTIIVYTRIADALNVNFIDLFREDNKNSK